MILFVRLQSNNANTWKTLAHQSMTGLSISANPTCDRSSEEKPDIRLSSDRNLGFLWWTVLHLLTEQSFDSFNEGITLIDSAEKYKARFGYYPERILADTIYRNRDNRRFCKEHGILLSGPRLGRPKAEEREADREQAYQDRCDRNIVESRNGIAKRLYGLDRILAYLADTAKTEAALIVFAMNAAYCLRVLLCLFLQMLFPQFRATVQMQVLKNGVFQ